MRLELSKRGDYAVRAMLALADGGGLLTGGRIAHQTGIPVSFLPQVMGGLVHAGLVEGLQGRTGGYRLARDPETISLLSIVEAAEGDSRRTTCILRGGPCGIDGTCRVHGAFYAAQEALLAELAGATLASLTRAEPWSQERAHEAAG
jgi:Rrf2 family protein